MIPQLTDMQMGYASMMGNDLIEGEKPITFDVEGNAWKIVCVNFEADPNATVPLENFDMPARCIKESIEHMKGEDDEEEDDKPCIPIVVSVCTVDIVVSI